MTNGGRDDEVARKRNVNQQTKTKTNLNTIDTKETIHATRENHVQKVHYVEEQDQKNFYSSDRR